MSEFVEVYKDLCVMVDSRHRFHTHVDLIVWRAGTMMNNLLRSTICRSRDFMVTLWISHICALMEYASCVWNVGYLRDSRKLETLKQRWTHEVVGMSGLV